jgi:flavodoxin
MKTLVASVSQTGNTKKIADAIFEEIPGDKEMKLLSELDNLDGYDVVFFGFPIIAFGPHPDARDFLQKNAAGKQIALFVTHGALEDQEEVADWLEKCRAAAEGAELVGTFDCQGEVSDQIIEYLLKSDDEKMRSFGEAGPATKGQPDESRIERARVWARDVMAKLQ